ncbi:MAG: recombinase family protein, partial [Sphingobium sp.]
IREALQQARQERDSLISEQRELEAVPVIALHPQIAEAYSCQIADLTQSLTSDAETTQQARRIIRSLIDQVIITPREAERGVNIEVSGRLASILALATGEEPPTA